MWISSIQQGDERSLEGVNSNQCSEPQKPGSDCFDGDQPYWGFLFREACDPIVHCSRWK